MDLAQQEYKNKIMNYLGDLSKYDYEVLKNFATKSNNILEFGVGASTQILRNYCDGKLTSVDTSDFWVDLTKKNLEFLNINKPVDYYLYDNFSPNHEIFDFIFNDGVDSLRNDFGISIWKNLSVGGVIAYHDTRRNGDIGNVINLINTHKDEVESVSFNEGDSNITLIKKKNKDNNPFNDIINVEEILTNFKYYDWNDDEGKTRVNYGISVIKECQIPDYLI
jgi:hypothetical protein